MTSLLSIKDHVMIAASGLVGHCQSFPRLLDLTDNDRKALDVWLLANNAYCDKIVEAINAFSRTFEGKQR